MSAGISGLKPGAIYHFRVVATNASGTSEGADATLTTLPNPPTVLTDVAAAIKQTTATLHASVNPNGANVSDCRFEYGTGTSYGSSAPCSPAPGSGTSPVGVSAPIEGLSANATYHFRIVATNAGGTSEGADATLTTLPNAPTVLTGSASAITKTTATLGASVNPNGGNVSECVFEYGTSVFYEASRPCTSLPGSGTSAIEVAAPLEGLLANTTYHFRIVAANGGGTSNGADAMFTTVSNAPAIPSLQPAAGPESGGVAAAIAGVNFTGASAVNFGSASATSFTVNSDMSITAVAPAGTGTVDVTVTAPGGTSALGSSDRFSYLARPAVTKVSPGSGGAEGGTSVTITGTSLEGATAVRFGSASASSFTVTSATSITATAPAHAPASVDVTVTTPGGTSATSSADVFKFTPTITAVSPNTGPAAGGTSVTVTGAGFATGAGATTFHFGTTQAASASCTSTTECTVVTPAHAAGTVDVKAAVNAIGSPKVHADQFTFQ